MNDKKLFIIAAAAFSLFIFLTIAVNSKMNNAIRSTESVMVSPAVVMPPNAAVAASGKQDINREIAAGTDINTITPSSAHPAKTIDEMKNVAYERPLRDVILPE